MWTGGEREGIFDLRLQGAEWTGGLRQVWTVQGLPGWWLGTTSNGCWQCFGF